MGPASLTGAWCTPPIKGGSTTLSVTVLLPCGQAVIAADPITSRNGCLFNIIHVFVLGHRESTTGTTKRLRYDSRLLAPMTADVSACLKSANMRHRKVDLI